MPAQRQNFVCCGSRTAVAVYLSMAFALVIAGCDKIQIPQMGQQPAAAPTTPVAGAAPAAQAAPNSTSATVDGPVQTGKPDPKAVVAAFLDKASKTGQIEDQDLLTVTELTEGLEEVKELRLAGDKITDAGVARLSKFPKLANLDLSTTRVTNDGIAVIKDMPELRSLGLAFTEINDKSMGLVGQQTGLKELNLAKTGVTDFGLSELGDLDNLEVLDISSTGITGAGFEKFKKNKKLRVLRAQHSAIQNEALKYLTQCPIEELNLDVTGISDPGFIYVARMSKMKRLSVEFCGVSDLSVNKMVVMKDLETVSFRNNARVSSLLFNKLVKCKNLKSVNAAGTMITATDAAKLMKLLPNCKVVN